MENFSSESFENKNNKSKNKLSKTFVTASMLLASMWYTADWQEIKQQPKPKNKIEKSINWKKQNTEFKSKDGSVRISGNGSIGNIIESDWNMTITKDDNGTVIKSDWNTTIIKGSNNGTVIQSDWNIVIDEINDWDISNITIVNWKVWINGVEQKKLIPKSKAKSKVNNNTNKKISSVQ